MSRNILLGVTSAAPDDYAFELQRELQQVAHVKTVVTEQSKGLSARIPDVVDSEQEWYQWRKVSAS
jgi:hypothetical protein